MELYKCSNCKTKKLLEHFGIRSNTNERYKCCIKCRSRGKARKANLTPGSINPNEFHSDQLPDENILIDTLPLQNIILVEPLPEPLQLENVLPDPLPLENVLPDPLPLENVLPDPLLNFNINRNPFSNVNVDDIDTSSIASITEQNEDYISVQEVEDIFIMLGYTKLNCSYDMLKTIFNPCSMLSMRIITKNNFIILPNPHSIHADKGLYDEIIVIFPFNNSIYNLDLKNIDIIKNYYRRIRLKNRRPCSICCNKTKSFCICKKCGNKVCSSCLKKSDKVECYFCRNDFILSILDMCDKLKIDETDVIKMLH